MPFSREGRQKASDLDITGSEPRIATITASNMISMESKNSTLCVWKYCCRRRNSPYFCSQKLRPNFQTRTLNFYILGSAALQATSSRRLLAPQSTHGKRGARLRSSLRGGALCSVRERGRNCENSYQRRRPVADSVLLSGCLATTCFWATNYYLPIWQK